jgi:hypothetical protein
MAKRDPDRTRRLRTAVRYLVEHGNLVKGNQAMLARHFHVSRQRVHQIVVEERRRMGRDTAAGEGGHSPGSRQAVGGFAEHV